MRRLPPEILARAKNLFWDVDPSTIDPEKHEDFVLGRVLTEGDWDCVQAMRREVGDVAIRDFVQRCGTRRLDVRTRRFFEAVFGISCETTPSTHASAPLFLL